MKKTILASLLVASVVLVGIGHAQAADGHKSYQKQGSERQYRDRDQRQTRQRSQRPHDRSRPTRIHRQHRYANWHPRYRSHWRQNTRHHRPIRTYYRPNHYNGHSSGVSIHATGAHLLPTVAGAVIGGAVGSHIGHGDSGSAAVGAIMGAIIANKNHRR